VQCRPPDRPRVQPGGGRPATLRAAGPPTRRQRWQTTTTDAREQNNQKQRTYTLTSAATAMPSALSVDAFITGPLNATVLDQATMMMMMIRRASNKSKLKE